MFLKKQNMNINHQLHKHQTETEIKQKYVFSRQENVQSGVQIKVNILSPCQNDIHRVPGA